MSIYKKEDLDIFAEKIDEKQEEVKKRQWNELEPTGDLKMQVVKEVLNYVKEKKRKIYGSYAHNKLVMTKNKNDAFLDDTDIPDIDFYSPDPIYDVISICNMFQKKGFKNITGGEAQHEETYKIFVDDAEACDITYVPRNIYNKIPYNEINGLIYVNAHWALIDYLRIISDPLTSWEIKLEKRFKRLYLILKNYPFPNIDKKIKFGEVLDKEIDKSIIEIAKTNSNLMLVGMSAYNYYVRETNTKDFEEIEIPYHEIISINYVRDTNEIVKELNKKLGGDIRVEEYYPFFQFTDFSSKIYYKNKLILIVYGNNHKCLPLNKISKINLASFSVNLLFCLVSMFKYRSLDDKENKEIYMTMISHFIKMRNYYLKKNNKTIMDKGLFGDFVVDCIGKTISSKKESNMRIQKRLKANKPAVWRYKPEDEIKDPIDESGKWRFKNSSGNIINNQKNFRLNKPYDNDENIEIEESEE